MLLRKENTHLPLQQLDSRWQRELAGTSWGASYPTHSKTPQGTSGYRNNMDNGTMVPTQFTTI